MIYIPLSCVDSRQQAIERLRSCTSQILSRIVDLASMDFCEISEPKMCMCIADNDLDRSKDKPVMTLMSFSCFGRRFLRCTWYIVKLRPAYQSQLRRRPVLDKALNTSCVIAASNMTCKPFGHKPFRVLYPSLFIIQSSDYTAKIRPVSLLLL